ncbi:MAG: large subunit ribosomal protein [Miltoncostaeaceae bacterium]|jgi:large subunit ribosomal protein L25|nr:large subunit ribosomal protein [Miltoncostaeaceae bacterium]
MPHLQLSADERTATGGGPSRRLRQEGRVPGVVYQPGRASLAFSLPDRELRRTLLGEGGRTSVIDLRIGGGPARSVIFKEWQVHPVRGDIVHVDFQEVDLTEAFETSVAIHLEGTPIGVREGGGVLDQGLREVSVSALPDSLPDQVAYDVSAMEVGDSITVGDLVAPEGSTIVSDPDLVVASVLYPTVVEETEGEAAEDLDREPEVVGGDAGADESE